MKQFIFHSKPSQGGDRRQPRCTIAVVIEGEEARFGVSRCSKNDQFTKRKGAQIAIGRAKSRHPFTTSLVPDQGIAKWFVDAAKSLAEEILNDPRKVEMMGAGPK